MVRVAFGGGGGVRGAFVYIEGERVPDERVILALR